MRILWCSNGIHTHTGYGNQTKYAVRHLQERGHEVAVLAWYGVSGGALQLGDTVMYPRYRDSYGADVLDVYARQFGADVILSLIDLWVYPPDLAQKLSVPWLAWFPIDGDPAPAPIVRRAQTVDYPMVYSEHGLRMMAQAGVDCAYVPHGIDRTVYYPGDKGEARKVLGLPDDVWLATMVAANKGFPCRKSFVEVLQAFVGFRSRHPEAVLYLHTEFRPRGEGLDFAGIISELGLEEAISFADQEQMLIGIPDETMADIYRASDVLLSPSMGEGFGLPIAEAQACGCPVITQDCASMSELTFNGLAIEPLGDFWVPGLNYWQHTASPARIEATLEYIYGWSDDERDENAAIGVEAIHSRYDWPVVMERYWDPFLAEVEAGLW